MHARSTKINAIVLYNIYTYHYTTVGLSSRNTDIKTVALLSLVYCAINAHPTTITRNENWTFSVVCLRIIIILHVSAWRR